MDSFYPYKSNIEYFTDENDNIIVDHIGTFENLQSELEKILSSIGLDIETEKLGHTNKSSHLSHRDYFESKMFKKAVTKMIRKDLDFYEKHKFNLG